MDVALTLERRRGGEAVLRDAHGRRFVLPTELVPADGITVRVDAKSMPPQDPKAAGRSFLNALLTHP